MGHEKSLEKPSGFSQFVSHEVQKFSCQGKSMKSSMCFWYEPSGIWIFGCCWCIQVSSQKSLPTKFFSSTPWNTHQQLTISWLQISCFFQRILAAESTCRPTNLDASVIELNADYLSWVVPKSHISSFERKPTKKKTHRGEIVYCGWGKGRGCGCSWRCFFLNESLFYLDFLGANEVKKVVCLEFIWLRDWWLSHLRAKDDRINPENSKDSFWIRMFGAQRVDLSKGLVFSTLRKCFPFFVSSQEKHTNRELMITPSWNFPSSQVV